MDPSLSSAHEMSANVDEGPYSLWYDQSRRRRLYIGECDEGQVIVMDSVKDFTATKVQTYNCFSVTFELEACGYTRTRKPLILVDAFNIFVYILRSS